MTLTHIVGVQSSIYIYLGTYRTYTLHPFVFSALSCLVGRTKCVGSSHNRRRLPPAVSVCLTASGSYDRRGAESGRIYCIRCLRYSSSAWPDFYPTPATHIHSPFCYCFFHTTSTLTMLDLAHLPSLSLSCSIPRCFDMTDLLGFSPNSAGKKGHLPPRPGSA